jgi:hypothetical protein
LSCIHIFGYTAKVVIFGVEINSARAKKGETRRKRHSKCI